jgi:hypothetical protein
MYNLKICWFVRILKFFSEVRSEWKNLVGAAENNGSPEILPLDQRTVPLPQ